MEEEDPLLRFRQSKKKRVKRRRALMGGVNYVCLDLGTSV